MFIRVILGTAVAALGFAVPSSGGVRQEPTPPAWIPVAKAIGREGKVEKGGVYRVGFPRSDLHVTVYGTPIKPSFALGTHVEFLRMGKGVMVMGDLVLKESEVNRVVAHLEAGGVEIAAVHEHLPDLSQHVWWTHIHARGDAVPIARTIRAALALTATPPAKLAAPEKPIALDAIFRTPGKVEGGIYKVSFPRAERITDEGVTIPPAMGTATALNFEPLGGGRAAINGDFVMRAGEVNRVIRALQAHKIDIVSLHSHGLTESPRLFFMHFWATGNALTLARGLDAAVSKTHVKRG